MADKSIYKVSVVLDPVFGDRLVTLAQEGPVWIVESPANRAAAESCWKENPGCSHLNGVTLFKEFLTTCSEDTLISNLSTIDLHHGEYSAPIPYSMLEVIGAPKNPDVKAAFAEFGFDLFEDTLEGFKATRSTNGRSGL